MRNWAQLLRQETLALGGTAIDTSASDLESNLQEVAGLLHRLLVESTREISMR